MDEHAAEVPLTLESELAFSKSRLEELSQVQHTTRLAAAMDERLRQFHARKIAELTSRLSTPALAAYTESDSRSV